jgi:CHAT domain-containing protein
MLDNCWWPGQTGTIPADPAGMPPGVAYTVDSLLLAWVGQVLPQSISLRTLATGARRAGAAQGSQMARQLLLPRVAGWWQLADQNGNAIALIHAALLTAEVARRAGEFPLVASALGEADTRATALAAAETTAESGATGSAAVARGAVGLAAGDALLTPLSSPEALGFDLEDRNSAQVLGDPSQRAEAARYYHAARAEFDRAGAQRGVAAVDLRLAWLHGLDGDPDAAAELLGATADRFGQAGDGAGRVLALTHLVVTEIAAGRSAASRPGPVAEIAGWARGPGSRSYALGCAGIVHATACTLRDQGAVEAALAAFDLARRLLRALGDADGELRLIGDLGELYTRLNSRGATISTLEEAIGAATAPHGGLGADAAGELPMLVWSQTAQLLMALSNQLYADQDPDGLDELARRMTVLLARAPGGPRSPSRPDDDLLVRDEEDRRRLAELGAARGGPFGGGPDWAQLQAANVEFAAGALRDLIATADVMAHRTRAERAARRGATAEADREFAAALATAEPIGATLALSVLAMWGRKTELLERTTAFLDAAPDIDPEAAATLWLNAEQYDRAAAALAAAGREAPPPAEPAWRPDGHALRARISLGQGAWAHAADLANDGLARFEAWFAAVPSDSFRVSVLDNGTVRRLYQASAMAAMAAGQDAAGFAAADRPRFLALGTLVTEASEPAPTEPGAPSAVAPALRAWRQARAEWAGSFDRRRAAWHRRDPAVLASTAEQLSAAQARQDSAANHLERVAPGLAGRRGVLPPPVAAAEIASRLEPGTVALEYFLGDDHLLIWALTSTECRGWREEVDTLALGGIIRRLHAGWQGNSYRGAELVARDAADVAARLLGPVQSLLDDHDRVLVMPFGAMHLLPFHALPLHGRPLGASHVVSQLPAASLIPRLAGRPRPRRDGSVLVVGDPATDPARHLRRLPGAHLEAVTVARVLGAEPLTGAAADEPSVRAALATRSPVVHLATHGLLDDDAPYLSSLALSGGDELTVAELLGLGLDTDVAILSACDSGRGTVTLGGDVVGLARGLLAAGARHSVVSLWPVDDQVGCLTMAAFAERLAAGDTVAEALAKAQRTVRAASAADREDWYAELADQADVPATAAGRRGTRDIAPPPGAEPPAADDPFWWAPFVHVGV